MNSMNSTTEQLVEQQGWVHSRIAKISGHALAVTSLLWSTFFWLLFFYINASETAVGPTDRQELEISSASLLLAITAAILRSKVSWPAIPAALLTFAISVVPYAS
jgi:hypothetical protein